MFKRVKSIFIVFLIFAIPFMVAACMKNNKVHDEDEKVTDERAQNSLETEREQIKEPKTESEKKQEELKEQVKKIDYQKVKPNELGHIMIIMYHGLVEENPPSPYQRRIEDFKKDLNYLYDNGYRLISMKDYINNNISVEAGYTPIIITFDDGISTSFSLTDEDGKLSPTPNSAVDIMNKFCNEHPDFGKNAIFYINGDNDPFAGDGSFEERVKYLTDNGYEVSSHTYSHAHLSKLDKGGIQEQLGKADKMIKDALPGYIADSFAYPFGERPKEELRYLIKEGIYEGEEYGYKIALREGPSGPFYPPYHIKFDSLNVPRVRGSEGEEGDLWWYLKYYEEYPHYRYISDGNPNRIAVTEGNEKNVNMESLNGKELYVYTIEE
ncbi:MAG: polysaccharide deacetylase family protein [Epulopiscium sp.]|nr:polysaccharide deacetylase family protein [Candidatus Epulonipiscium sp.]